jgi:hypothetical protein
MRNSCRLTALVALSVLCGVPAAFADEATTNPTLAADWIISAGLANTNSDPRVGLAPDGSRVTLIDLDVLGVDADNYDTYLSVSWQAPERWRLSFTTYTSKVEGGRFSDRDYEYGDLDIPAGSGIELDFKSTFYILNADYAFWNKPRWEAGVGIGIYALDWSGGIQLVEGGSGSVVARESDDFLAPLPTLGVFARYAYSDRLAGRLGVDWLSVNIDSYDGEVFALAAGVDWWFSERWGVSGGFNLVDIEVTVDDKPFNQYLEASWESIYLKLNLAF